MSSVFIIGGTNFLGRHIVERYLSAGKAVTIFNRGQSTNPFSDDPQVTHRKGDRTNSDAVQLAIEDIDPNTVVDCVARHPDDVSDVLRCLDTVEKYIVISSTAVYDNPSIPVVEKSGLQSFSGRELDRTDYRTYGVRKAECERVLERTSDETTTVSLRPTVIYGPDDYTGRFEFWIEQVENQETVLVPGDGGGVLHTAYVKDVAEAVYKTDKSDSAEGAYNVASREIITIREAVEYIAEALDTNVSILTANERELAECGLSGDDFPLYRNSPFVVDTSRLADCGWTATAPKDAIAEMVRERERRTWPTHESGASMDEIRSAVERLSE